MNLQERGKEREAGELSQGFYFEQVIMSSLSFLKSVELCEKINTHHTFTVESNVLWIGFKSLTYFIRRW